MNRKRNVEEWVFEFIKSNQQSFSPIYGDVDNVFDSTHKTHRVDHSYIGGNMRGRNKFTVSSVMTEQNANMVLLQNGTQFIYLEINICAAVIYR